MEKKKIILIGSIIVIISCIIFSILILTKDKDEPITNENIEGINTITDKELLKDVKVEKLTIKNQSIIGTGSNTKILLTVSNNTSDEVYIDRLYVKFNIENQMHKILLLEKITLSSKEEKDINMLVDIDLTNTTSIEYAIENDEKVE